jgi:glucose-6-phosphate isomerase
VDEDVLQAPKILAQSADLGAKRERLFTGEVVNPGKDRLA